MRRPGLPPVVIALVLVALAPGPVRADGSVSMQKNKFEPRDLVVKANERVTWTNNDGSLSHSVSADDGSFDSNPKCGQIGGTCMRGGESFSHTFSRPGRFQYYCRIHGAPGGQGMAGAVEVK